MRYLLMSWNFAKRLTDDTKRRQSEQYSQIVVRRRRSGGTPRQKSWAATAFVAGIPHRQFDAAPVRTTTAIDRQEKSTT